MNELFQLKARGAQCVGGDLILDRVVVAHLRHGQCIVTPEGGAVLAKAAAKPPVAELPVAQAPVPTAEQATPAPAAKPSRRKQTAATVEPSASTEPPADSLAANLDDLLQ